MKKQYVQYGCGFSCPDGWINFDASPTLRIERLPIVGKLVKKNKQRFPSDVRFGDIIAGLPIEDESCAGVYCSHILEHLALDEFRIALRNTKKMLVAGGIFRFVLPDLEYIAKTYLKNTNPDAALEFMKDAHLGKTQRPRSLGSFIQNVFGNSNHLTMWDYKSMEAELADAGFVKIRRANINDSTDRAFDAVETDQGRWLNCLGVECYKA